MNIDRINKQSSDEQKNSGEASTSQAQSERLESLRSFHTRFGRDLCISHSDSASSSAHPHPVDALGWEQPPQQDHPRPHAQDGQPSTSGLKELHEPSELCLDHQPKLEPQVKQHDLSQIEQQQFTAFIQDFHKYCEFLRRQDHPQLKYHEKLQQLQLMELVSNHKQHYDNNRKNFEELLKIHNNKMRYIENEMLKNHRKQVNNIIKENANIKECNNVYMNIVSNYIEENDKSIKEYGDQLKYSIENYNSEFKILIDKHDRQYKEINDNQAKRILDSYQNYQRLLGSRKYQKIFMDIYEQNFKKKSEYYFTMYISYVQREHQLDNMHIIEQKRKELLEFQQDHLSRHLQELQDRWLVYNRNFRQQTQDMIDGFKKYDHHNLDNSKKVHLDGLLITCKARMQMRDCWMRSFDKEYKILQEKIIFQAQQIKDCEMLFKDQKSQFDQQEQEFYLRHNGFRLQYNEFKKQFSLIERAIKRAMGTKSLVVYQVMLDHIEKLFNTNRNELKLIGQSLNIDLSRETSQTWSRFVNYALDEYEEHMSVNEDKYNDGGYNILADILGNRASNRISDEKRKSKECQDIVSWVGGLWKEWLERQKRKQE